MASTIYASGYRINTFAKHWESGTYGAAYSNNSDWGKFGENVTAKQYERSFVKFDTSSIAGQKIQSAKLYTYFNGISRDGAGEGSGLLWLINNGSWELSGAAASGIFNATKYIDNGVYVDNAMSFGDGYRSIDIKSSLSGWVGGSNTGAIFEYRNTIEDTDAVGTLYGFGNAYTENWNQINDDLSSSTGWVAGDSDGGTFTSDGSTFYMKDNVATTTTTSPTAFTDNFSTNNISPNGDSRYTVTGPNTTITGGTLAVTTNNYTIGYIQHNLTTPTYGQIDFYLATDGLDDNERAARIFQWNDNSYLEIRRMSDNNSVIGYHIVVNGVDSGWTGYSWYQKYGDLHYRLIISASNTKFYVDAEGDGPAFLLKRTVNQNSQIYYLRIGNITTASTGVHFHFDNLTTNIYDTIITYDNTKRPLKLKSNTLANGDFTFEGRLKVASYDLYPSGGIRMGVSNSGLFAQVAFHSDGMYLFSGDAYARQTTDILTPNTYYLVRMVVSGSAKTCDLYYDDDEGLSWTTAWVNKSCNVNDTSQLAKLSVGTTHSANDSSYYIDYFKLGSARFSPVGGISLDKVPYIEYTLADPTYPTSPPTNVSAEQIDGPYVKIDWTNTCDWNESTSFYKSTNGEAFSGISTFVYNLAEYVDRDVEFNNTYRYAVSSVSGSVGSAYAYSNQVVIESKTPERTISRHTNRKYLLYDGPDLEEVLTDVKSAQYTLTKGNDVGQFSLSLPREFDNIGNIYHNKDVHFYIGDPEAITQKINYNVLSDWSSGTYGGIKLLENQSGYAGGIQLNTSGTMYVNDLFYYMSGTELWQNGTHSNTRTTESGNIELIEYWASGTKFINGFNNCTFVDTCLSGDTVHLSDWDGYLEPDITWDLLNDTGGQLANWTMVTGSGLGLGSIIDHTTHYTFVSSGTTTVSIARTDIDFPQLATVQYDANYVSINNYENLGFYADTFDYAYIMYGDRIQHYGSGNNGVTWAADNLWLRGIPNNEWHTYRWTFSGRLFNLYYDDVKIITDTLGFSGNFADRIRFRCTGSVALSGIMCLKNIKIASNIYPPRKKCTFWNTLGSNAEILTSRIGNGGWFSGVSYLAAKFDNGMATTANNQYVAFGDTLKHIHQNQGTIDFWYQPHFSSGLPVLPSEGRVFGSVSGMVNLSQGGGIVSEFSTPNGGFQNYIFSGNDYFGLVNTSGVISLVSGILYHFAYSWDNTVGAVFYVDGQFKKSIVSTWKNNSSVSKEFCLGNVNYFNFREYFSRATIDNFKIYNFYMSSGINDKLIYNNRFKEGLIYKPSGTITSTTYDFLYSGEIDYGAIRWINTGNVSGKVDTKSTDTGWDFSSADLYVADNALMTTSQGVSQRDRYAKWQMQLLTADQTTSPTLSGKVEIDYYDKMFHESGYFETRVLRFNDVFVSGVGYNFSPLSLSWQDSKVNIYDVKLQKRDDVADPSGIDYEWSNSASTFATTSGYSTDNEALNGYFQFKIFFSGSRKYTPTLSGIVLNERYGDAASGIWTSPIMDLSAINIKNLDSFTIVSEAPTTEQVELLYRGGNNINDFIWKQWYGVSGYGTSFLLNGTGSPKTSTFTVDSNFNLKNNRYFQYMIMLSGVAETKSAKVYKTIFTFDAERTEIPRFIGNITDISPSFGTSEDLEVAGYEKCRFALSNKRLDWEFKNYYIEDVYKYIIDLIKDEVDVCYMTKASGDFESSIHETSGKAEEIFIDINRYNGDTITSIFDELATVSTQEWWTQPQLTSGNVIKNVVYVKPRPDVTDVSRNYHKGKDLMNVQISESTKGLMNRGTIYAGYFSGTTNRIVEFLQDEKSINKYGLREFVLHDDSVTSSGYARFKLQAELDKNANPEIQGSCQIVPGDENLQVNDMIYLRGWFDTPVAEGWGSYQLKFTSEKITNNLPEDGSYTSQTDFSNKRPNIDDMQKDMMQRVKNLEQANEPQGFIEYLADYLPPIVCSGELDYTPSGEATQFGIRTWAD